MEFNLFGWEPFKSKEPTENKSSESNISTQDPKSSAFIGNTNNLVSNTGYIPVFTKSFNGEKTAGELGLPIALIPDFRGLRLRAYEASLTSDVIKIITGKFFKWVIGSGLKLQAEPNEEVLRLEGINVELDGFKSNLEAYFQLYASNNCSDYSGMCNLHDNAAKSFESAFIGGDSLVVLRINDDNNVTVQVIDGQHLVTPIIGGNFTKAANDRGNIILHGIEINPEGKHVAFYVNKMRKQGVYEAEYERIEAYGKKTGCLMAWVVYGLKHRIDHQRGIPAISSIIEKVQKLDRYTEASVASAEERAKVPWTIEHDNSSTGENPLIQKIRNINVPSTDSFFDLAGKMAKTITTTEEKEVYNLPIGASFKAMASDSEINYEPFFKAIFMQLCAAVDIPPEVALQQYNSNYSASRAAINGWDYVVKIYREKHARNFYQNVYNLWLYVHVLKDKVKAPGYLRAKQDENMYVIQAYNNARFTGSNMPHIDPLKEVNAVRAMLGDETTALMSLEQASEQLNLGDWNQNYNKFKTEIKKVTPPPTEKKPENADKRQTKK